MKDWQWCVWAVAPGKVEGVTGVAWGLWGPMAPAAVPTNSGWSWTLMPCHLLWAPGCKPIIFEKIYLQKLKCGKKVSSWKTSTVHWVVGKLWWFIVMMSKCHHRGSHCRPNVLCLTLNKEHRDQMHLDFTMVIGAKMMQSLVFMKKTFWRKGQGKMQGHYEEEELSTC